MSETQDTVAYDVWSVQDSDYPAEGTTAEKLRFLLNYAVLAPSERNSQPWLFRVRDDCVELYADRDRTLPVVDPHERELTMSCGAALFYLRIALHHFGYEGQVALFPDPEDPDLLARITPGAEREPGEWEETLFKAIPLRHTNRYPFRVKQVPEGLLADLEEAARREKAWLYTVAQPSEHFGVANLIAEADQAQWSDPDFRSEIAEWVHPSSEPAPDGIPGYALALEEVDSSIGPLLMQAFDMSKRVSNRDYKLAIGAPALVLLGTQEDTPPAWLQAGQALAAVLLRAAADGVSAGFFNQPLEIPEMRRMLSEKIGRDGYPQLLFRLGYGYSVRPTPRRKASDVAFK